MKVFFLACICVGVFASAVEAAVKALASDIKHDCGPAPEGPVKITFTNSDPAGNPVAKLSSPRSGPACSATSTDGGVTFVITDAVNNCNIVQIPGTSTFVMQVTVQENAQIYQDTDPTFFVQCEYIAGDVVVKTSPVLPGAIGTPSIVSVEAIGNPDMNYTISILDSAQQLTSVARFGDSISLNIAMSGTDTDENGIQVESCVATSGGINVTLIENFCVVDSMQSVFQLDNFIAVPNSNPPEVSFPLKVFAVEGSTEETVEFICTVNVCPAACGEPSCPAAAKRRRRDVGEPTDPAATSDKRLIMGARLEIVPIYDGGSQGQTGVQGGGQGTTSSESCMQSLGFMVTVGILAVLLLVAMVAVIFMFTTRRREMQKAGA